MCCDTFARVPQEWVEAQKSFAKMTGDLTNVYIQVSSTGCMSPTNGLWSMLPGNNRLFAAAASLMCLIAPLQVQLDGTVRSSGVGMPNWRKLVDDLAPLDSIRTTLTDGIGPSL